ncbi:ABC-2 family transporter protein [Microlunatus lacustris]
MRTWAELAAAEARRYSAYRLAVLAGVFTNSVFGFLRVGILVSAVTTAGGSLAGYTPDGASTYVWLGQALLAPLALMGWSEIADRVRTGDIAVDLARPLDLQLSWWARDLGRAAFVLPARGLPPLLVGALTVGVALPSSWTAYPLGLLSVFVALSLSFALRFLLNLAAFWVLDFRGIAGLFFVVVGPLCGLYVPVHLFPGWLGALANATPFPSMFQAPIDVLSGRVLGADAAAVLAVQLGWLMAVGLLGRLVLARATRRLVVQGG